MIIDHNKKFVFIHVYRTAGSSIEHAFGGANPHCDMHIKLEDLPEATGYFSFAFIRNPWDRILSSYMYLTKRNKFKGTWEEYIKSFTRPPLNTTKKFAQHDMVKNCDYIGRFEYLQKDFNDICKHIGVPQRKLPHIWKTNHQRYVQVYTPEQIDIIDKASAGDIEQYGFTFKSSATKNFGRIIK